jgi:poly(3-hydroxybutyrate) depolymerase
MNGDAVNRGALHERDRRREALLDELRRSHRAEPAPAELRQRLLERAEPQAFSGGGWNGGRSFAARAGSLARGVPLARRPLALALAALLALGVALHSASSGWFGGDAGTESPPELAVGPEPRGSAPLRIEPAVSSAPGEPPAREPVRLLDGKLAAPCPLASLPRGAVRRPQHSGLPGFTAHTFEQTLPSCGPITRRYLELVPPGLARRTRAPVVILLHDAGEAAETVHAQKSRLNFEDIAQRNEIVLIYANAAPGLATSIHIGDSGAWQTDRRTHGEIDDEDYLRRIAEDLGTRDVIDANSDIFLVGYGDGAAMALDAAVRSPGLYAGVAAFAPSNLASVEPARPRAGARLSRVMMVIDIPSRAAGEAWYLGVPALARRWADALGLEQKVSLSVSNFGDPKRPTGTVQQFDVSLPATGSSGVRIYLIDGKVTHAPSALHAWNYLTGIDGADANAPDDLAALPFIPVMADGHSVLDVDAEEAEGEGHPSLVLGEDVVSAPPPSQRPAPDPDARTMPF